ncbi:MAG: GNAT family N-acetyltransferase [Candidatus Puniceispirillaceae bacterium]
MAQSIAQAPLIRPYQDTDLHAVTDIYGHHVRYGTASFETEPLSKAQMAERISTLQQNDYPVIVATDENDQAIGFAYAGPHKARYGYRFTVEDSIYVAPDHIRQGIGHALLSHLITMARAKGFRQMMAVIGDSDNQGSIGLHRHCGFEMVGIARNIGFKFERHLDVVFMQCDLS